MSVWGGDGRGALWKGCSSSVPTHPTPPALLTPSNGMHWSTRHCAESGTSVERVPVWRLARAYAPAKLAII